jgi:hypothetical protein
MRSFAKIGQIFKQMNWKDKDSTMNSQVCPYLLRGGGGFEGRKPGYKYVIIHTMMHHTYYDVSYNYTHNREFANQTGSVYK